MQVRKFAIADAKFERSPDQTGDIFTANIVDQRDGAPISVGFGRWGAGQPLTEKLSVDDVMIVLEGSLSVSSDAGIVTAGPGEIIHMPKGETVTIEAKDGGAVTAYVTYPNWQEARGG